MFECFKQYFTILEIALPLGPAKTEIFPLQRLKGVYLKRFLTEYSAGGQILQLGIFALAADLQYLLNVL